MVKNQNNILFVVVVIKDHLDSSKNRSRVNQFELLYWSRSVYEQNELSIKIGNLI